MELFSKLVSMCFCFFQVVYSLIRPSFIIKIAEIFVQSGDNLIGNIEQVHVESCPRNAGLIIIEDIHKYIVSLFGIMGLPIN